MGPAWIRLQPVQLRGSLATGGVSFEVVYYRFRWDGKCLYYCGPVSETPLAYIGVECMAVQFAVGFAYGRLSPQMPGEDIPITPDSME